jgi:alpha-ketoglutarate-dependent taurine dioxygenase
LNLRRHLPKFGNEASFRPVLWNESTAKAAACRITHRYRQSGYAIFKADAREPESMLLTLSNGLGLGKPYIPVQYALHPSAAFLTSGFNKVQAAKFEDSHRGFATSHEQLFHCDGTLDPIGRVATSILFCVDEAADGGETTIFDSVDAFQRITDSSPDLKRPLFDSKALTRRDIGRTDIAIAGPVFALGPTGELRSRFSIDNTCEWDIGFAQVNGLQRAYDALLRLTEQPGFSARVMLRSGWGIVLANSKVAHGRTSFRDTSRLLLRGLFLRSL